MSWTKKLRHPREMLKKDQEVQVKVMEISKENRKINLGIKQIEEDPWPMIETLFSVDSIVEGEVVKIAEKFIVVNLEHDLEGIVPLGQMTKKDRKDLSKAVKVGDKMQLKVLEVNRHEKKIVLSREQAMPKEPKTEVEAFIMQQPQPTDKIEIPTEVIEMIVQTETAAPPTESETAEAAPKKAKAKTKKAKEEPAPEPETTEKPAKATKTTKKSSKATTDEEKTEKAAKTAKKTTRSKTKVAEESAESTPESEQS